MNDSLHQFMQLVLQAVAWVLKTAEVLWFWSWTQISSAFTMSWGTMPAWKLTVGVIAIGILAALMVGVVLRAWEAFGRIAAAFWTMTLTAFAALTFVVVAALFSRGFQWVVASVPDTFWDRFI